MKREMLNEILIGLRRDKKSQNKTDCFSSDNYQSIKELLEAHEDRQQGVGLRDQLHPRSK